MFQENEKNRDILIEQRFHRNIIGAKGENIKEIRDMFNQVNITFPEPGVKSDVVTIRGPKQDVDQCYRFSPFSILFNLFFFAFWNHISIFFHRYMQQLNKDYIENNYQVEVPIFKQFHKNIIGKGGATIKKVNNWVVCNTRDWYEPDIILNLYFYLM